MSLSFTDSRASSSQKEKSFHPLDDDEPAASLHSRQRTLRVTPAVESADSASGESPIDLPFSIPVPGM